MWLRNFFLVGFCSSLLFGCGFRPLLSESQPTTPALETVKISLIKERVGQNLRNRLLDLMTPQGSPTKTKYRLDIKLVEEEKESSFRKDLVARRKEISLKAYFELVEGETGKVILKNLSEAYSSFSLGSRSDFGAFSSYTSEQDARTRMVEILAQDIRLQVATFLLHSESRQADENHAS